MTGRIIWLKQVIDHLSSQKAKFILTSYILCCMDINLCATFRVGNIPTLLSAPGVQRTPCLLHHGFKTPQSNTGHAPLSAVTHHPHREELVNISFFSVHFPCISTGDGETFKVYFNIYIFAFISQFTARQETWGGGVGALDALWLCGMCLSHMPLRKYLKTLIIY